MLFRSLVYTLFLCSGATALIYQVAWTRSLSLIFGASHQAIAIVLGSFMAGLALGGFVLGRRSAKLNRPLRVYGLLEFGVAGFALALPAILALINRVYVGAASNIGEVNGTVNALRVALAFGAVVLPTFFMGGTLPVLTSLLVRSHEDFSGRLSWLYAINTFGAVAGACAAGFVLLPNLGVSGTIHAAFAVNIAIALLAIVIDSRLPSSAAGRGAGVAEAGAGLPARGALESEAALRLAYWGTALAGASALALEVLWTRALAVSAGTTTYAFTVMLAAFLTGIALGSAAHAAMPLRRVPIGLQFGAVMALLGVCAAATSQLIPRLPQVSVDMNQRLYSDAQGVRTWTTLALSFAVMLVPCFLMGVAFPLAGQARLRLKRSFGASVGDLVGLNTLGCIAGSMLAGFVLIPFIGLQRGMLAACAAYTAYGLLVLAAHAWGRAPRVRWVAVPLALACAVGACAAAALIPRWDPRSLGAFRNNTIAAYVDKDGKPNVRAVTDLSNILYYKEGNGSIVSVLETDGQRSFIVMGKVEATDSLTDIQHEFLLGHLPVLLHPDPKSALVIGLGAGITLGGVCAYDTLDRIELVEIEKAVLGVARQFSDVNGDALNDPRLKITLQDGRNHLLTTRTSYDVITADPIHPWAAGSAYLYTTEYYKLAAARLNAGGVMAQWLPLYELSEAHVKSVIASFASAFKDVTAWQTAYDLVLIGRDAPAPMNLADLERRMASPRAAVQLTRAGLGNALSFVSELTLDDAALREYIRGARVNTDDNLYLEFSTPLTLGTRQVDAIIRSIDSRRANQRSVLGSVSPPFATEGEAEVTLAAYRRAKSETVALQITHQQAVSDQTGRAFIPIAERLAAVLAYAPEYSRAKSLLSAAKAYMGIGLVRAGRLGDAAPLLEEALRLDPTNYGAAMELATILIAAGRPDEGVERLRALRPLMPMHSGLYLNLGAGLLAAGKPNEAATAIDALLTLEPENARAHHDLGVVMARWGKPERALTSFEKAVRLSPRNPEFRANYAVALAGAKRHADAVRVLRAGLRLEPENPRLNARLAWGLATAPDGELRDGAEALRLAEKANAATNSSVPQVLDILAAAQAELGRFGEAAMTARKAADIADKMGAAPLATQIRSRIALYDAKQPARD